jgi:hypothetical protein
MTAFTKIIGTEDVPASGFAWRIEADEPVRLAIARRLGIPAVSSLSGEVKLDRTADGFDLKGRLEAVIERICVSSLEPLIETISEDFEVRFVLAAGGASLHEDIEVDAPEPVPERGFDLADILVQQLALAMDPYPHKAGAQPLAEQYADGQRSSPFEALKGAFAARGDKE